MKKKLFIYFILPAVLLFSGCGSKIISSITVFHKLPEVNKETIYYNFEMAKEQNSLKDEVFFQKLESNLLKYNFVKNEQLAQYRIRFKYTIDNGTTTTSTYSYPIYGQIGGGTAYHSGTVNSYGSTASYSGTSYQAPKFGIVSSGTGTTSSTSYVRNVKVQIYNNHDSGQVYDAEVKSGGSNGELLLVIDELLEALFKEFPGQSQQTRKESVTFTE